MRTRKRRLLLSLAALLSAVLAVAGWSFLSLRQAADDLQGGVALVEQAGDLLEQGDTEQAAALLGDALAQMEAGSAVLEGIAGRLGASLPLAGGDIALARETARAGISSARFARALTELFTTIKNGGLDAGAITRTALELARLEREIDEQAGALSSAPESRFFPELDERRRMLVERRGELKRAARAIGTLAAIVRDGSRFLVLVENSAEMRGTGGLIGAWALLGSVGGTIELEQIAANEDLPVVAEPVEAPEDYLDRYGRWDAAQDWTSVNLTPDYPTAARVITSMWSAAGGESIDGVITIDAVALRELVAATGPVLIGGRTVAEDELLEALLSDAYRDDQGNRVPVLLETARQGWQRLSSGVEPLALRDAFDAARRGGHLRLYASDPELQRRLAELDLTGGLAKSGGDYLLLVSQNAGGNKLDYYLTRALRYRLELDASGDGVATVSVRAVNDAPASGLPDYALGTRAAGGPAGTHQLYMSLYTPTASAMTGFRSGPEWLAEADSELGRSVYSWWARLAPAGGESRARIELESSGLARREGEDWVYTLRIDRQPALRPLLFEAEILLPPGAELVELVHGGEARYGQDGVLRVSAQLEEPLELTLRYRLPGQ